MTLFHIIRQLPTLILSDLCWSFICMFSRGFSSVLKAEKSDSSWTLQSTRHSTSIETLKWLVIYCYYYLRTFLAFLVHLSSRDCHFSNKFSNSSKCMLGIQVFRRADAGSFM